MHRLAGLGTAALISIASASNAAAEGEAPTYEQTVEAAKGLMLSGRSADARGLLEQLSHSREPGHDVTFLLGLLAIDARDYDKAIDSFRSILVDEPAAVRVRLELARAFYLDKDYDNAFRQFQFARAGKLDPGVIATIDRFMAAIRREKNWSYSLSLAIAPDSNINNGSSTREIDLFGLPFELDEDSRSRSGVGIAVDAAIEFAPRISETGRMRIGASIQRRDYDESRFDDTTVAIHSGPHFSMGRWDIGGQATLFQRRLGNKRLTEGVGASLSATHHVDSRTAIAFGFSVNQSRYPDHPAHDGPSISAWLGSMRALTPASSASGRVVIGRKSARESVFSNWWGSIAMGYQRDLAGGFTVEAEPSYAHSRYDAADIFFGKRRKDNLVELRLAVLNRRIDLSGFTPRVGVTLSRLRSSVSLHNRDQRRLEVGVTRSF